MHFSLKTIWLSPFQTDALAGTCSWPQLKNYLTTSFNFKLSARDTSLTRYFSTQMSFTSPFACLACLLQLNWQTGLRSPKGHRAIVIGLRL